LAGLRDYHVPEAVSWWPPAPGWWLLAGLMLVLLGAGWWYYQRSALRRLALGELRQLERSEPADAGRGIERRGLAAVPRFQGTGKGILPWAGTGVGDRAFCPDL
jgi:hypothetical protein